MTELRSSLLFFILLFTNLSSTSSSADLVPVDVGVILDLGTSVGQTCHVSLNIAVADYYAAHPNSTTALRLHFRDSLGDAVTAASHAVDLISNVGVTAILGPQTSSSASFVADIGANSHVPVVSFTATSPSLSPSQSPFFIRAAASDSASAAPIAALVSHYGWRRVVPIYEDSDFGSSFIPSLVDALDAVGSQVPYRVSIPASASDDRILEQLYMLKTMQTRVFVVHFTLELALRVFAGADKAGMMEQGFAWIATDGVTSFIRSVHSSALLDSMQGVLGVKPHIPKSERLASLKLRWKQEFLKRHSTSDVVEISTAGILAYDALFAVAMAVESSQPLNDKNPSFSSSSAASEGNNDLLRLPVLKTGEKFRNAILATKFDGVGGEFRLVGGELDVSAFRIVNIGSHAIGFWTKGNGLRRQLGKRGNQDNDDGEAASLGPVIWAGESTEVPKGFVEPTSFKGRMRIAVPGPVEAGFQGFLSIERDPATNATIARGYVIDVFEAAVRRLPYALPFEYVPYVKEDGEGAGDYDTMVKQVPRRYDAVVGDVTITADRTKYVEFTMPYTVSGVSMVVPLKDRHGRNASIFLKPLTVDLWIVSLVFFIFTGLVVWAIEHRINEEFRGPPSHHIGTVFYFTFSTLVFSHKEGIVSNLSRVVVIVWLFVVFILQASYTASLTSMLTVRELQPTVSDFNALRESKQHVGYLEDSFVKKFLIDKMGFDNSTLRPYKSPQQYADALAKGSKNGGVAAVVDEIPYLKVFLKYYCANYTMVGQPNKTGGFGFVFPNGSPLVQDLSRAILNLTESDEMVEIERRWFGDESTCADQDNQFSSQSFDFMSFWVLFLITGVVSITSLLIYMVHFLHKNRHSLNEITSDGTPMWKLQSIAKLYDRRDLNSYTFRRDELRLRSMAGSRDQSTAVSPSVRNHPLESPVSIFHDPYDNVSAPLELTSSAAETPPHIGMPSSNA